MAPHPDLILLGQRPRLGAYLRSMWERREFALDLPMGELRARNMDTALGAMWHLLNPLLMAAVYFLVFGLILKVDRGTDNFVAFLTIGLFVFFFTRKSLQTGAGTIVSNVGLIRAIKFPRAILPLAAVLGELFVLAPTVVVMLLIVLITGEPISLMWLLLLPMFAVQTVFNVGIALFSARMAHHFRDVEQLLPYLLTIWFYISGIFFVAEAFITNPRTLAIFQLNPMFIFPQIARDALLHQSTEPRLWLMACGWALASLLIGAAYFLAREQEYGRA